MQRAWAAPDTPRAGCTGYLRVTTTARPPFPGCKLPWLGMHPSQEGTEQDNNTRCPHRYPVRVSCPREVARGRSHRCGSGSCGSAPGDTADDRRSQRELWSRQHAKGSRCCLYNLCRKKACPCHLSKIGVWACGLLTA
ncbi:hypothetical protein NDU88_002664 [Pleurodeles waltl]|uniref:Uncharacterized protein n=1 Tax=Pleurodeles waltl TaxID=8319 RepID=A0AAV7VF16_PLEWA|nr:hypothetical protein NDU88_002664 [Pleurodeles waltl]